MPSYSDYHDVILHLDADKITTSSDWLANKIAMKAESVSISTTKNVFATPLPFTGLYYGEAQTIALDWGNTSKQISISGVITDQYIKKKHTANSSVSNVLMTAHEIAQLLHSFVDSSFMQPHQNLNAITILIPTRIDGDYAYRSGIGSGTPIDECPVMPFTYKVRAGSTGDSLDAQTGVGEFAVGKQLGNWPDVIDPNAANSTLAGFVRSFNTTFTPGQNFIDFSLEFEVATNPMTEGGL